MNELISKSQHIKLLAEELLDDIELSRLKPEQLLLKAQRLARLHNNKPVQKWLEYEMLGYIDDEEISLLYMDVTGRWIDKANKVGWWGPLAQIEGTFESNKLIMQIIRIPDITYSVSSANEFQYISSYDPNSTVDKLVNDAVSTRNILNQLSGIKSKVLALLHTYVSNVYYETIFSGLSESIFESFKNKVDVILADKCKDALDKIPALSDRLSMKNKEAVSQALNTCRRIIDTFADAVFPPSDMPFIVSESNTLDVSKGKIQNRINACIFKNCQSKSRCDKLRHTLKNLYDRVSTGVHNDVSFEEAKSLFLETYIFLGEVLTLSEQ
jgi:hypothetical protein